MINAAIIRLQRATKLGRFFIGFKSQAALTDSISEFHKSHLSRVLSVAIVTNHVSSQQKSEDQARLRVESQEDKKIGRKR